MSQEEFIVRDVNMPAEGLERVIYLALCPDLAAARRYIALKDVK